MSGKVIIFAAPSGAGKTTISRYVLQQCSLLEFSVSAATRPPRQHEVNGKDYFFMSPKEFKQRIDNQEFVEWQEVYPGHFYGTLHSEVERIWQQGHHVVFDVDVLGALNLKRIYGDRALAIFIMPPSIDVLEKRLRSRKTDDEKAIHVRLAKAEKEISTYRGFDRLLVNSRLPKAKTDGLSMVLRFLSE